MRFASGQTLASYEILGSLGAGGMGEVYRARDTRLEREVALKVLPPELADDAERMSRFEREAKVLASLQHPNIVTVFSIEQAEGARFLTMELVEGESLRGYVRRGGLPLERFYPLAAALADGLNAAHRKGVTHRDLKPENVVLDGAGRPKVLDFGLAKRARADQGREPGDSSLTGEGLAVGTIPYMAPEALRGGEVDARSDVFSLGVVLYELLTGSHPFPAQDSGEQVSAILRDTPPSASDLRPAVPAQLARLLRRCLEKDPDRRLQTALDLRNELEELAAGADEQGAAPGPGRRVRRVLVAVLVVAVAGLAFGMARWLRQERRATTFATRPLVAAGGLVAGPNWSPRSEFIAYARHVSGSLDVFVQPVSGGEPQLRVDGPGDEEFPRWSPDGSTLAYLSTSVPGCPILLVGAHSGSPRELIATNIPALEVKDSPDVLGDRPWSQDGRSLLVSRYTDKGQLALFLVDVNGSAEQLTFPPAGCDDGSATFSFDGERIAFTRMRNASGSLWTMSVKGADPQPLLVDAFDDRAPVWRPEGEHIVFTSTRTSTEAGLWEISVGTGRLRQLTFDPKRVYGHTVSASDQLAYSSFWHDTFLYEVDVDSGETRQLTDHPGDNYSARYSPDGQAIAYSSSRNGHAEIWLVFPRGGPERRITNTAGEDLNVDWSPDGEQLAFLGVRDGVAGIFLSRADGGGQRALALDASADLGSLGEGSGVRWSPDGALLAFVVATAEGPELWCARTDGTGARRLIRDVEDFDWYLDSRRVVYTSSTGGVDELRAQHVDTGEWRLLWKGKHAEIDAAPDGTQVAFCTGEGHQGMGLARLLLAPPTSDDGLPTPRDEEPELLVPARDRWHVHMGGWSRDGKRIVYTRDEDYSDVYELIERR